MFTGMEEVKKTSGRKKLNFLEKSEPVSIETKYTRKLFEFMFRAFEVTLAQVSMKSVLIINTHS
jgi:hypothetical protein